MKSIQYNKQFVFLGTILTVLALVFLLIRGVPLGIDFTGGTSIEVVYQTERPTFETVQTILSEHSIPFQSVQMVGERSVLVRLPVISDQEGENIVAVLESAHEVESSSFATVGPSIGSELKTKALTAIIVVAFVIIIFIAYAFRHVSKPVSSWRYGLSAIITLLHDVLVTSAIMTLLAWYTGQTFDALFVVALLTILGLSINDTIVVFDRIRETLLKNPDTSFSVVAQHSLQASQTRAVNTSLTTILVLVALVIWGPSSTSFFALTLAVGMAVGTYSSLFFASPLLVFWHERASRNKKSL